VSIYECKVELLNAIEQYQNLIGDAKFLHPEREVNIRNICGLICQDYKENELYELLNSIKFYLESIKTGTWCCCFSKPSRLKDALYKVINKYDIPALKEKNLMDIELYNIINSSEEEEDLYHVLPTAPSKKSHRRSMHW
jgi:hypothetical protein